MVTEQQKVRDLFTTGLSRYVNEEGDWHAIGCSSKHSSESDLVITKYPIAYRNYRENDSNIFELIINPKSDEFTGEQLDAAFAQVFSERRIGSTLDLNIRLKDRAEYIIDKLNKSIEKFSGR